MKPTPLFLIACTVLMSACGQSDRSAPTTDHLYYDYRVIGEESLDIVTCVFQFRNGGPEGEALAIPAPGSVKLDSATLTFDSAGLSGIYYEATRPVNRFKGEHTVVMTDAGGTQHPVQFSFDPFTISELPERVSRDSFEVYIAGLPGDVARLQVVLVDTAFANRDLNEGVEVVDGWLRLEPNMLRELSSGPVSLELYHERTQRLPEGRGRVVVRYGLKRDLVLE